MTSFLNHIISTFIPSGSTGDVLSIITGTTVFNSGTFKDVTVPTLVLNKSLLICSFKTDGANQSEAVNWATYQIKDTTTLRFERATTSSVAITITWFLIQYTATSPCIVQRGATAITGTSISQAITAVIKANSFPLVSMRSTQINMDTNSQLSVQLENTTNIRLRVQIAPTTATAEWQVVENSNYTVTEYIVTILASTTTKAQATPAIVLADTWLVGSSAYDANSSLKADNLARFFFTSTTNINLTRRVAINKAVTGYLYTIEAGSFFAVDHFDDTINSGVSSKTQAMGVFTSANSIMKLNMAAVSAGTNNTNNTQVMRDLQIRVSRFNDTGATIDRGAAPSLQYAYNGNRVDFTKSI